MNEFKKLGLSDLTLQALEKKGFTTPTPIQEKTIPILLEGNMDVIGKAQTGTGKTACFGLPILETITENASHVQALILAPTRELALQVASEMNSLKGDRNIRVTTIYGGASMRDQISDLKRGVDIVVGTPGRVIDMINRNILNISMISFAVLDEADEMLNMGFVEDIQTILSQTNKNKRMLFFSATMPKQILNIAHKFMREYVVLEAKSSEQTTNLVNQVYYEVKNKDKFSVLRRVIGLQKDFYGIIFCKTKASADALIHQMQLEGINAAALHGDISQNQREKILIQFRNKSLNVLVATDVAARGIDVDNLTHVINFSMPQSPETYVHRIGRTGRAGREGTAITFLSPAEIKGLRLLEKVAKCTIKQGRIPTVDDVLVAKKLHIIDLVDKIVETDNYDEFKEVSNMILAGKQPEHALAAVLKYAFKDELKHDNYADVRVIVNDTDGRSYGGGNGRNRSGRGRNRSSRGGNSSNSRGGFGGRREGRSREGSRGNFGSRDRKESNRFERGSRSNSRSEGRSSSRSEGRNFRK